MAHSTRRVVLQRVGLILALPAVALVLLGWSGPVDNEPVIAVSSTIPDELNPPFIYNLGAPRTRPRRRPRPSRGRSSSPSTGRPRNRVEGRASATRRPKRAASVTRIAPGRRSGRRFAAKSRFFPAQAARRDIPGAPRLLDTTRCRSTSTRMLSRPAIRHRRRIRYPGSISTRSIRSPWTACMRAPLRMTVRSATVRRI